jgi:hypothetical protein
MHKFIQLISNFLYKKNMPFYESTCSLDEIDETPNQTKMSNSWNFETKGYKAKNWVFFNYLTKTLCSMGSKCLTLGASHMWRK